MNLQHLHHAPGGAHVRVRLSRFTLQFVDTRIDERQQHWALQEETDRELAILLD